MAKRIFLAILLLGTSSAFASYDDPLPVVNHPGIEFQLHDDWSFYSHIEYVDFGYPDQNFDRLHHPENLNSNTNHPSDLAHFHTPLDFQNQIFNRYKEAKHDSEQNLINVEEERSKLPASHESNEDQFNSQILSLTTSMETVLAMKKLESAYKIYERHIIETCLSNSLPDELVPKDIFDQKYKEMIDGMPNDYQIVINDTSTHVFYDKMICECIHFHENNRLIVSVPIPVVQKTQNFKLIDVQTVPYDCGEDQVCEISFEKDFILYLKKDGEAEVAFVDAENFQCIPDTKYCEIPSVLEADHEDNLCIRDILGGDVDLPHCKVSVQEKSDENEHDENAYEGIIMWFEKWVENCDEFSSFTWLAHIFLVINYFNLLIR